MADNERRNPSESLKIFVVGRHTLDCLEGSYVRAFRDLGFNVIHWDMRKTVAQYARWGKLGATINNFWPSEPWLAKANRELLKGVFDERPDILIVGGNSRVTAGGLAQIRATLPECKSVLIWPDSLLYCFSPVIECLPLYDLVATFSKAMIEPLKLLGARQPEWLPLGFDPHLHSSEINSDTNTSDYSDCDASLVGAHTPEREDVVVQLVKHGFRIKVWGPMEWRRVAKDKAMLKRYWQGRPLWGKDFAHALRFSPVSLNPINPMTWPAANMRFFEILGCGGVPLSARCPELENDFPDQIACFYYGAETSVIQKMIELVSNRSECERVARVGHERILGAHTYAHRARRVLELLATS